MQTTIRFYSVNASYGEFSNFSGHPIRLKGQEWATVEHYFQAHKFFDRNHSSKIKKAPSPMRAAQLGRSRKVPLRRDWEKVKDNIMYDAVYAKFTQHKELTKLLLETEDAILIEASPYDDYWGEGAKKKGLNKLGKILMKVRKKLQASTN
ncbi:MAG: NADAR family protein [Saprospiraceae bacterium]|nr:NADAR family protein [Saprospiraceae bacterium]